MRTHDRVLWLCVLAALVLTAASAMAPAAEVHVPIVNCAGYYDDFQAPNLASEWTWINEDDWSLGERPGFLRIYTDSAEDNPTYLLRDVSGTIDGVWSHLAVQPDETLQHAGIAVYQDDGNWLQLTRQTSLDQTVFFVLRGTLDAQPQVRFEQADEPLASAAVRIRRDASTWIGEYAPAPSAETGDWTAVGSLQADLRNPRVGLAATGGETGAPVDFDDFCAEFSIVSTPTTAPTATPEDLELSGRVYDAVAGPTRPVADATVSVLTCFPRRFETLTDADGQYDLSLPAEYVTPCRGLTLEVWAPGYEPFARSVPVPELYAQPERDFALEPWRHRAYVPLIARSGTSEFPTATPTTTPSLTPTATPSPTQTPAAFEPSAFNLQLDLIVDGLSQPVHVTQAGDGSNRLFLVEKQGTIRMVTNGELTQQPFLDVTERVGSGGFEQGLLSVAFHPAYAANGYFFVNYTDTDGDTVVERYRVGDDPDVADPSSARTILTLDQPASNHNGGLVLFGPDGYLYIGTGDGGRGGDPWGNAQNPAVLLGKMLRIDVDGPEPYAIPPDNPFLGNPEIRDEIWALGLRNPWRYSFDRVTGDLYIADVGQNAYEEVNVQPADSSGGENYGWDIMEGFHCYEPNTGCDRTGLTLPVAEYDHTLGCSVTGGYAYRGSSFPEMGGAYYFGDYCSGRIWALYRDASGEWTTAEMLDSAYQISSFGEDEAGELYLTAKDTGRLYRLVALTD